MPRVLYADCFSGISGDLFLGALLDLGFPASELRQVLDRLGLGVEIEVREDRGDPLRAMRVVVRPEPNPPERSLADIEDLIARANFPEAVVRGSLAVFRALAKAEGRVHGLPPERVHFHEVGSADSIADIVGAAAGLAHLGVDLLVCSPLPLSRGWIATRHGDLPLPAPAVCELCAGLPVTDGPDGLELVTPTGAAIVKALATTFGPLPPMTALRTGYGAGTRTRPDGRPNLLRLVLGTSLDVREHQEVDVIETNLDDWAPEGFPLLCERLLADGALDVSLHPILMKKGRPGHLLQAIAPPESAPAVKDRILAETTAIGLRFRREQRLTLPRVRGTIDSAWGAIQVKKVLTPAGPRLYPEYESCRTIATRNGIPLAQVYQIVALADLADFREIPSPEATR